MRNHLGVDPPRHFDANPWSDINSVFSRERRLEVLLRGDFIRYRGAGHLRSVVVSPSVSMAPEADVRVCLELPIKVCHHGGHGPLNLTDILCSSPPPPDLEWDRYHFLCETCCFESWLYVTAHDLWDDSSCYPRFCPSCGAPFASGVLQKDLTRIQGGQRR